ncbi:hypothetical protein EPUS_02137 [Endocarpon pusillum Z07020]|uniref:DUF7892 domain-containing protein n=1 Tax=Endocarpon pusillum (strain Z07020 / HMAS-L-300199) TaxID=1263415 RepID=U1HPD7_ENDPU|nr:uncharacterized protein EPUS_02137 [Endocarpon pusillum Z07020]ERF72250.1 hypothetical protein EPUS_02137 [Endocarpon pusillum Z07020]
MCVNRTFNNLLAPDGVLQASKLAKHGALTTTDQEHLWSLSRRAFFPGMPRPLFSRSEHGTWKLIRAGPGNDYVRVIWPFAVRSCGNCLRGRLQKETDLLFSASSALLPALPFAFFTPSLNYVASITLRNEPPPTGLQLTKWYFKPQVDDMKAKLDEVRELGAATAEEWFKGLEVDGKEKAADTARWEHWEAAGGFQAIAHGVPDSRPLQRPDRESYHHSSTGPSPSGFGTATANTFEDARPSQAHPWAIQAPQSTLPPKPAISISPYGLTFPSTTQSSSLPSTKPYTRVERSIHDVNEKKNARRLEIEKRCAELNPPIKPSTLALMESFAAALQIAMPLTDQAWEHLRPRLLAQREVAEQQEREQLAKNQFLIQQAEERKQQEAQLKEAKEILDREWEESQKSVREKLEMYADTFVREQWQNGDAITKGSCAQFAADMLLHVRHRFYTSIAQEDAHKRSMGIPIPIDSPQATPTRKLTLENMRWVYENKIKPFTEHYQKELFLCNACDNHGKYYSLDSVVQHFAAKHTDSLSMGTAVVYWKSDWPELPPFDPNPTAARASMYVSAVNASPAFTSAQFMHNTPSASHGHATGMHINPEHSMYPGPHIAAPAYGRPAQSYGSVSPAYQEQPSPKSTFYRIDQAAVRGYNPSPITTYPAAQVYGHPQAPNHQDWRGQQAANNATNSYQQAFPVSFPNQQPDFSARPGSALSQISQNPPYASWPTASNKFPRPLQQAVVKPAVNPVQPGQPMGIYQVQIQELAKNAREIFEGTSDVAEMPDSVRVQVIIRHVVLRFKDKYTNEPNLALFTDGLNNNSQMAPMRALSGLSCKACVTTSRMSGTYGEAVKRDSDRRMHTLPALLAHFQSAHVEHVQPIAISSGGVEMPRLDWKFDMVEMPDAAVVRNLIYSRGITQMKLNLIATVLPSYFPSPLPQVEPPYSNNDDPAFAESEAGKTPLAHDFAGRDSRTTQALTDGPSPAPMAEHLIEAVDRGDSQQSRYRLLDNTNQSVPRQDEESREDEYDPHRPAYTGALKPEIRSQMSYEPSRWDFCHENEDAPARVLVSGQRAPQDLEAVADHNRVAAASSYAVPQTGQPLSGRSDTELRGAFVRDASGLEPRGRWAVQESKPAQTEPEAAPGREPLNAAEQFLQNFDPTAETFQERTPPAPAASTPRRNEYSHDFYSNPGPQARTEDLSWLPTGANAKTTDYSERFVHEATDGTVDEPHHAREYARLYGGRHVEELPRTERSGATSPDNQSLSKVRVAHLPPHLKIVRDSPSRRPNSRFERYEAQRQGSQQAQSRSPAAATASLPIDEEIYRESYPVHRPAGRQIYAARPEERHGGYPYASEVTHRRAPQSSHQIRYIENPRYVESLHDRYVEYVRVAPREWQASGGYYVQRPATHDGTDQYVGYEPTRPHEQIFEKEGHLYTRAPPSPEDYRNPYARQIPHQ